MITNRKKIFYKIYNPQGKLLTEQWNDASFESFNKIINGGYGECVILLPRTFEDFGENNDVRLNNRVDIYVSDGDTSTEIEKSKIIYSGYISGYRPVINNGNQSVEITLLGFHTKLSKDIYKSGTTTKITETATDVGTIMQNIMARYVAETTNPPIQISNDKIETTGEVATYTYNALTYLEAIDITQQMAPGGWFWYIDNDNFFHFKAKSTGIDHRFYFKKHFWDINVNKNMENIINEVLVSDEGANYFTTVRSLSQGQYGRRVLKKIDKNFGDTDVMTRYANHYLDNFSDPDIVVQLTIIDNNEDAAFGYDIESIEVGDTVKIEGFNNSIFDEGMIITEIEYLVDRLILTIRPVKTDIFTKILTNEQEIDAEKSLTLPNSYS
jgi:hypothetical protein